MSDVNASSSSGWMSLTSLTDKVKMKNREMLTTFVSDAPLIFAAGFRKHSRNIIGRECHSQLLHSLLNLMLVYETVAVLVKHLMHTKQT